jgi:hypothetical protein
MNTPPLEKISRGRYKLGPYEINHETWSTWRVWDCERDEPNPLEGFGTLRDAVEAMKKDLAIGEAQ